jgi:N-acetylglucosaminyl-diphospho-decaprenol L-rhamnosyltransferase
LLDSLAAEADLPVEVVHVDNASSDSSLATARTWPGMITQIRNTENRGFAAALKQGFETARGDLVLVVNPDIRLQPSALRVLVHAISSDVRIGAVGPKLVGPTGETEFVSARHLPNLRGAAFQAVGLHRVVAKTPLDPFGYPAESYEIERDVECLSGATMLIRRAALNESGGVDDRWFMYFEDIDICERLRRHGWRIRYCPTAVARHHGAASSPRSRALSVWLAVHLEAAVNLFFAVHRGRWAAILHRMMIGIGGIVRIGARPLLLIRSPAEARRSLALGIGLLRWSLTSRYPKGDPRKL